MVPSCAALLAAIPTSDARCVWWPPEQSNVLDLPVGGTLLDALVPALESMRSSHPADTLVCGQEAAKAFEGTTQVRTPFGVLDIVKSHDCPETTAFLVTAAAWGADGKCSAPKLNARLQWHEWGSGS